MNRNPILLANWCRYQRDDMKEAPFATADAGHIHQTGAYFRFGHHFSAGHHIHCINFIYGTNNYSQSASVYQSTNTTVINPSADDFITIELK